MYVSIYGHFFNLILITFYIKLFELTSYRVYIEYMYNKSVIRWKHESDGKSNIVVL